MTTEMYVYVIFKRWFDLQSPVVSLYSVLMEVSQTEIVNGLQVFQTVTLMTKILFVSYDTSICFFFNRNRLEIDCIEPSTVIVHPD